MKFTLATNAADIAVSLFIAGHLLMALILAAVCYHRRQQRYDLGERYADDDTDWHRKQSGPSLQTRTRR